jgi:type IV secretory pathway component VirB8
MTPNNLYKRNEKVIRQLEKMERMAWLVFAIMGVGYIITTIVLTFA